MLHTAAPQLWFSSTFFSVNTGLKYILSTFVDDMKLGSPGDCLDGWEAKQRDLDRLGSTGQSATAWSSTKQNAESCSQNRAMPDTGTAWEGGGWRTAGGDLEVPAVSRQPTGLPVKRGDSCNFCLALKWFGSWTWSLNVPSKWTLLFCSTSWKIASSVCTSKQQASTTWVNLWCFSSVLRIQRKLNKLFYVMTQRSLLLWNSKASLLLLYFSSCNVELSCCSGHEFLLRVFVADPFHQQCRTVVHPPWKIYIICHVSGPEIFNKQRQQQSHL